LLFGVHWLDRLPNGEAAIAAHGAIVTLVLYVAYLAVVVGSAAFTWRFIELPGQRFFGNFVRAGTIQAQAHTA
jgi:peptidoglycan/LPS O-acetylase OafA/YrhL